MVYVFVPGTGLTKPNSKARLRWIEKVDNASLLVVTTSYLGTASKTRSSLSHLKVGFHSFFKDTMAALPFVSFHVFDAV